MRKDKAPTRRESEQELAVVARGAGIAFSGRVFSSGCQFLFNVLVARMVGAGPLGLYYLGLTVANVAGIFSRMGLHNGLLKFVAQYRGEGDLARTKGAIVQAVKIGLFLGLASGLILHRFAGPIAASIFKKPELAPVIQLFSFSLPIMVLLLLLLFSTQALYIMKYTVWVQNIFQPFCLILLAVLFYYLGHGIEGILYAYVLSAFFAMGLAAYFLRKCFPEIKRGIRPIYETKKLLRYSVPMLFLNIFYFLTMWTDTLMLGYFRPSAEVGIYNAAMRVALLAVLVLESINALFSPMISDLYNRGERERLATLFKDVTLWVIATSLPICLLLIVLSKGIMAVFGPSFAPGWSCLVLLVVGQVANTSAGPVGRVLVMAGKQDVLLGTSVGIYVVNFILNILLTPRYGINGAAVATVSSIALLNLIMLFEVRHFFGMHPYDSRLQRVILSCAVALAVIIGLPLLAGGQSLWVMISQFILFSSVYALFFFRLIPARDVVFLTGLITKTMHLEDREWP